MAETTLKQAEKLLVDSILKLKKRSQLKDFLSSSDLKAWGGWIGKSN